MRRTTSRTALLLAGTCLAQPATAQAEHACMRYPTEHDGTIVFVSRGNLWSVGKGGGAAARLTSDPGEDVMPRFSPDGKWIAFTASYQGNEDVYVIPAGGGGARRPTFHSDIVPKAPTRWGPNDMVLTWTPDSQKIVYLSRDVAWNT
jgi:tricorn protease